jgi:hypothetical protein
MNPRRNAGERKDGGEKKKTPPVQSALVHSFGKKEAHRV